MEAGKIVLGTVQFGLKYGVNNTSGKPDFDAVIGILNTAYRNKITMLDTAEAYGNAHEVIGAYHQQSENKFQIITKFSSKRNDLPAGIEERVEKELEVLRIKSLYAYMFHSFRDFIDYYSSHASGFNTLKKKGALTKLGVSIYTNQELEELLNHPEVDLVQVPFNLLDNAYQRGDLLEKAKKGGMEIHTRSAFLQGLFFMETERLPAILKPLRPYLDKLRFIAAKQTITIGDLALNYAIQQKSIDKVLIGVDNTSQLEQNLKSLALKLGDDVLNVINELKVKEVELLNPANWNS